MKARLKALSLSCLLVFIFTSCADDHSANLEVEVNNLTDDPVRVDYAVEIGDNVRWNTHVDLGAGQSKIIWVYFEDPDSGFGTVIADNGVSKKTYVVTPFSRIVNIDPDDF